MYCQHAHFLIVYYSIPHAPGSLKQFRSIMILYKLNLTSYSQYGFHQLKLSHEAEDVGYDQIRQI